MDIRHLKLKEGDAKYLETQKGSEVPIRFASKRILQNEGIEKARGYKKRVAIPRIKQKMKYKKARHKMVSKGLLKKSEDRGVYSGERRGIRIGRNTHTDLK